MGEKFVEYAKLLRLPGLGGLSVTALYGGLSVRIFDYRLLLLFLMGVLSAIYGFVLNDYADVELDKLSKELAGKPLVKGAISKKVAVAISIFSLVGAYLIAFMIFFGSKISESRIMAVVVLTIAIILATIYNLYGKKMVGSDVLVGGAMFLFCLFGAMALADPTGLTWTICFLTFNGSFFVNAIEGGLKDADHDYLKGVKNIALSVGVEVKNGKVRIPKLFKMLGIAVGSCSAVLIFIPFLFFDLPFWYWQIGIIALFLFLISYLLAKMLAIQYFDRKKLRKMITAQAFLMYSVVPIMLMAFIGWKLALFLVFLPLIWYIVFTPLLGLKLFQPIL